MDDLKKSVADGKDLLATSISTYITTASDATFEVLEANMKSAFTKRYNDGKSAATLTASSTYKTAPSTAGTTFSYSILTNSYTSSMTCPSAGYVVAVAGGSGLYHSIGYSCKLNNSAVGASITMSIGYCGIAVYVFKVTAGSVISLTSSITRTSSATGDSYGPSMINCMRLFTVG
jgi:hypothetical protein